jgi:hypothetical protein
MKDKSNTTSMLFLGSRFLCGPLEAMYMILIFIVGKELNANILQLTALASAKPIVSLLAFYASSLVVGRPQWIGKFLVLLNIIGCIPCFLFPFVDNVWFFVFSYAVFITTIRASFPAWNEILKHNVGLDKMGSLVSKGTSINYIITIFVPVALSYWIDQNNQIWKMLFFVLALFQLLNTILICCLQFKPNANEASLIALESMIIDPWKKGWQLFKENAGFAKYLAMFFLGGAGIIGLQPILPHFFQINLGLSYTKMAVAISVCKGIAFIFTSPFWARMINHHSLYYLNAVINLFSSLFIAFLLASSLNINWIFLAYLMYGVMQAGCEISWNMSGPIFSREKDSISYSNLNLALVGFRGLICPFMGQLIFIHTNALFVFACSGALCLLSLIYAVWLDFERKRIQNSPQQVTVS